MKISKEAIQATNPKMYELIKSQIEKRDKEENPDSSEKVLSGTVSDSNSISNNNGVTVERNEELYPSILSTFSDEQLVSNVLTNNEQLFNSIIDELITSPATMRYRIKMKDSLQRVISILIRYQHLMGKKIGISRGEICRNLTEKYRKNLDLILMRLEENGVISVTTEHGKNYYKMVAHTIEASILLREELNKL